MSRKNRKNRTTSATEERHLHAVADGPGQQPTATTTAGKLRAALADNPGFTTAELALAAGVGRSTAGKILARWDRDGVVIRTAGTGPRDPDMWSLAPSATTIAPDVEQPGTPETAPGTSPRADSTTDAGVPAASEHDTAPEAAAADAPHDAATPAAADSAPGDGAPAALPEPPSAPPADSSNPAEPCADVSAADAETADAPTAETRLPKGGLRALVEEYLTAHAGQSFGPAKIGKDLGRSGGAVNNALEKLAANGYAIKTCEAPKRFAINPAKTDVPQQARDTA
ncbi:hypothetical protein [Amycolatopsis thermoflava]|uniref:hypothetical protein n=1 Tax=Amycolatopsis thermoflava TaxID=84480 RepID=UPI003658A232